MRGFIGVRRRLCRLALVSALLIPVPAAAAPLALEFEGVIPELTIFTFEQVGSDTPIVTTKVLVDVGFVGTMTFDSTRLAAASPGTWAGLPGEVYRDEDPVGGTDAGIETSEWMRTTMTLATPAPVTLAFDRDITNDIADATNVFLPYEGNQTVFYREGSAYGPVQGDVFAFELRNRLGFNAVTGDVQTDRSRLYDSWLYMAIATGIAFPPYGSFDLVDLFGPGAPTAFLWEDANPDETIDGRRTLTAASQFSHYESHVAYDAQLGQFRQLSTGHRGDLVLTRMELRGVAVPEPATGLLVLTAVIGGVAVRRRQTSRPTSP